MIWKCWEWRDAADSFRRKLGLENVPDTKEQCGRGLMDKVKESATSSQEGQMRRNLGRISRMAF